MTDKDSVRVVCSKCGFVSYFKKVLLEHSKGIWRCRECRKMNEKKDG